MLVCSHQCSFLRNKSSKRRKGGKGFLKRVFLLFQICWTLCSLASGDLKNFYSDTGEFQLLQRKSVSTWWSPLSILQVTESDTMRTFLSSILWALLLHCCGQTAQAEVFTSISRFTYRFNLITREGFWTQTSISEKKWRSNGNVT